MNQTIRDFLTRCFAPGDTIALLLRRNNGDRPIQRIVRVEQILAPRYLCWLAYENASGANVYVSANPLLPGSRRRTKENVAEVRHLYIDIDDEGEARVAALLASDAVPAPTAIIATSPAKYQVLWTGCGFDFASQEMTLKLLAIAFGGDPACTDCNRVLRIPGFLNWKYSTPPRVSVEYISNVVSNPSDFSLDMAELPLSRTAQSIGAGKNSDSEKDWAWVLKELSNGIDADQLTLLLAERRADKPNPLYYARRTVDLASARLWLLEGTRVEEVITMLEVRRHSELPASLCSGRAREIAATARRMIAHKKINSSQQLKEKYDAIA